MASNNVGVLGISLASPQSQAFPNPSQNILFFACNKQQQQNYTIWFRVLLLLWEESWLQSQWSSIMHSYVSLPFPNLTEIISYEPLLRPIFLYFFSINSTACKTFQEQLLQLLWLRWLIHHYWLGKILGKVWQANAHGMLGGSWSFKSQVKTFLN